MVSYSRKIHTDSAAARSAMLILGDDWEWQNGGAACEDKTIPGWDPDWWFPSTGQSRHFDEKAKAICNTCPLKNTCAEKMWDQEGTWGGMTESERKAVDNDDD